MTTLKGFLGLIILCAILAFLYAAFSADVELMNRARYVKDTCPLTEVDRVKHTKSYTCANGVTYRQAN